jgi:hypothetical protein
MMKFFMRAKMQREMTIASTTTLRPGEVRMMSALARAASVAPCTATPTSAFLSAVMAAVAAVEAVVIYAVVRGVSCSTSSW